MKDEDEDEGSAGEAPANGCCGNDDVDEVYEA